MGRPNGLSERKKKILERGGLEINRVASGPITPHSRRPNISWKTGKKKKLNWSFLQHTQKNGSKRHIVKPYAEGSGTTGQFGFPFWGFAKVVKGANQSIRVGTKPKRRLW